MESYDEIKRICPGLERVETIAEAAYRDGLAWADLLRQLEPDLFGLVGFAAEDPRLRSSDAYGVVMGRMATIWARGMADKNEIETCPVGV